MREIYGIFSIEFHLYILFKLSTYIISIDQVFLGGSIHIASLFITSALCCLGQPRPGRYAIHAIVLNYALIGILCLNNQSTG